MRHAYLITAYRSREQLVDLIDSLVSEESHVFVHLDKKADFSPRDVASGVRQPDGLTLIPQQLVRWGGYSHLRAILSLIRHARASSAFGYFHTLTGQCRPTRRLAFVHEYFEQNEGKEFIETFPLPASSWDGGGLNRLRYFHLNDLLDERKEVLGFPISRRLSTVAVSVQRTVGVRRPLPPTIPRFFGGSTYWSLSQSCVDNVLATLDSTPDLEDRFRHTFCAEEILFQSLIMNSPFAGSVAGSNLRYIDWHPRDGVVPAVLDERDLERIKESGALFARKFDPVISADLMRHLPFDSEPID